MNNGMFTTHHEIVSRLEAKKLEKDFNPDSVHDWCAEVENDILRDHNYFTKFLDVQLEVKLKKYVELPCNIHSIIDVRLPNNRRVDFQVYGTKLQFLRDCDEKYIIIDYKGTPVDPDTGDVLILRGHELLCEWQCIKNAFLTDWLNGKLDASRWQSIDIEHERATNVAVMDMRRITRRDFETMSRIQANMLPQLGRVPIYKGGI